MELLCQLASVELHKFFSFDGELILLLKKRSSSFFRNSITIKNDFSAERQQRSRLKRVRADQVRKIIADRSPGISLLL